MAVHIKEVDDALERVFGEHWQSWLDLRSLQSIACYFRMTLELEESKRDVLVKEIGWNLHANSSDFFLHKKRLVAATKKEKIDGEKFDFLLKNYGQKLIIKKLNEFSVFGGAISDSYFYVKGKERLILCSIADFCGESVKEMTDKLDILKRDLDSMSHFKKRLEWFKDVNEKERSEKLKAAIDYFAKKPVDRFLIASEDDLELYFLDATENNSEKELSYRDICGLYNNRKTRRKTTKKQCNFSLDEDTIKFIDALAKSRKISRSEILERVFRRKNSGGLPEMIQW